MKVRFVFHKPRGEWVVGRAIVAWTWVLGLFYNWKVLKYNYSHEECWIPGQLEGISQRIFVADWKNKPLYRGQCFSSTTRGGAEGVRFACVSEVLHHPERWDYIECEVDPERLEVAVEEAKKLVGRKYDYWGIFGFVQPFIVQDPKKYFCSELCDWFKVLCGIHPKRQKRISPRRSAYLLAKVWGKPKAL